MKHPKPAPVVVTTICSLCGQDWGSHGDDPTTLDCIRLLKAEVARRPLSSWWYATSGYSNVALTSTSNTAGYTLNWPSDGDEGTPVAA